MEKRPFPPACSDPSCSGLALLLGLETIQISARCPPPSVTPGIQREATSHSACTSFEASQAHSPEPRKDAARRPISTQTPLQQRDLCSLLAVQSSLLPRHPSRQVPNSARTRGAERATPGPRATSPSRRSWSPCLLPPQFTIKVSTLSPTSWGCSSAGRDS